MEKQFVIVDGISVEINGEKNLLEIIRKAGIQIPTFCYHSELSVYGACRMCMVENEWGGLDAACSTPPRGGMKIKTNTERLRKYRKNILELLLANHCRDCTVCDKNNDCKLQNLARIFNIEGVRFPNNASVSKKDKSSPCIVKDQSKCILCGDCVRMCNEVQNVGAIDFAFRGSKMVISTAFGKPMSESPCVGCGQCVSVCPTGALMLHSEAEVIWKAIHDKSVKTTVQIAPAVRVAIGKELGCKNGENVMGKIVTALRHMGFDEVYDTTLGADLTVLEETSEFVERLNENKNLPLITSCCPGWIQYAEKKHPELLDNISTCRSPMQMMASLLKEINRGKKHFHVAIMPCTAKKFEAIRDEFKVNGEPNVDAVLTTKGLIRMIKEAGIVFEELEPEAVDTPFSIASGAGVIFGVTGGVTEAVLRRVSEDKTRGALLTLTTLGQRGTSGIKEFEIPYGEKALKVAVVSGLGNAEKIIKRLQTGEHFDFIEIMACPEGCINGGGQPFATRKMRDDRSSGLYLADKTSTIRCAEKNPLIDDIYKNIINGRAHELLHVHYHSKKK